MVKQEDMDLVKELEFKSEKRIVTRLYTTYAKRNYKQIVILNFDDWRIWEDLAGRKNQNIEFQSTIIKYTDKDNLTYEHKNIILCLPIKSFVNGLTLINKKITELKGRLVMVFNVASERCYNILGIYTIEEYKLLELKEKEEKGVKQ